MLYGVVLCCVVWYVVSCYVVWYVVLCSVVWYRVLCSVVCCAMMGSRRLTRSPRQARLRQNRERADEGWGGRGEGAVIDDVAWDRGRCA